MATTTTTFFACSEEFPIDVPARAEEITIPADLTPEKVLEFQFFGHFDIFIYLPCFYSLLLSLFRKMFY